MKKTVLSLLIGAILSLTAGEVLIDSNSSEIWAKKDQGETNNIVGLDMRLFKARSSFQ